MWRGIRSSAAGNVPASRSVRQVYRWGGIALAGLGVVQFLIVAPRNSAWLAYLAAIAIGVGVWFLPTRTVRASLGLAIAVATVAFAIGTPALITFLGAMAAMFSLSRYVQWRSALWGYLAIVVATASVAIPQNSPGQGMLGLVYPLAYLAGAWVLGWLARLRANYVQTMMDAAKALERDHAQQTALAAASERVRIARELHESISNRVGLMVVEAQAASETLTSRPEQAAVALDGIGLAGRQAINDLRQMLGVLRDPTSSLDVSDLVEPARVAGLTVDLVQDGDDRAIQSQVRSAVYRIIQDALTNTLRGSTATKVRVTVHYGMTSVDLEVIDNSAAPANPAGTAKWEHGLTGIWEHVREVNGEVIVEARSDGPGLRVRAILPTDGAGRADETLAAWA
ncbi:MAG TPA: histidine kinase [Candidatus Limnocylindrales bacterium]|nr:histidine kinase [Candidatus Limnocylindrales bacterium]